MNPLGVFIEEVDGRLVVLDQARNAMHTFNETASLIWKALKNGQSTQEIAAALTEQYQVSPEVALGDVEDMRREFRRLRILN